MPTVTLTLTLDQAVAVRDALDLYTRVCIGQLEEVAHLVRYGTIPVARLFNPERQLASPDQCDEVVRLMDQAKTVLGYPTNGSNGIGHPHVHITGTRAYEVEKTLAKVIADYQHPTGFRGVDHDGLTVRYTQDPAPGATLDHAAKELREQI